MVVVVVVVVGAADVDVVVVVSTTLMVVVVGSTVVVVVVFYVTYLFIVCKSPRSTSIRWCWCFPSVRISDSDIGSFTKGTKSINR